MVKKQQVTLRDIAKELNVSKVTVSKALRDHPDIGDTTKTKVKKAAEEMGYLPNFMARNLSSNSSKTIGLVVPKIAHHFFASTIEAIYQTAYDNNYEVLLTVSQENEEHEIKHIQTLLSMRVDGLLVSVTEETKNMAVFEMVRKSGVPLVFFDRVVDGLGFSKVISDDEGGSFDAICELIESGYEKIAHLAGYQSTSIGKKRLVGYRNAMKKYAIPIPDEYVIEGGFGESDGYRGFNHLMDSSELPEVIFAVTYPVALGVISAARENGINVPEDMDLICFGGSEYNRFITPSLTYIDQPTTKIGNKATELLLQEIENPEETGREIVIPTNLVKRDTCLRCNRKA